MVLYTDLLGHLPRQFRPISILSRTLPRLTRTQSRLCRTRYTFTCCEQYTS